MVSGFEKLCVKIGRIFKDNNVGLILSPHLTLSSESYALFAKGWGFLCILTLLPSSWDLGLVGVAQPTSTCDTCAWVESFFLVLRPQDFFESLSDKTPGGSQQVVFFLPRFLCSYFRLMSRLANYFLCFNPCSLWRHGTVGVKDHGVFVTTKLQSPKILWAFEVLGGLGQRSLEMLKAMEACEVQSDVPKTKSRLGGESLKSL